MHTSVYSNHSVKELRELAKRSDSLAYSQLARLELLHREQGTQVTWRRNRLAVAGVVVLIAVATAVLYFEVVA